VLMDEKTAGRPERNPAVRKRDDNGSS